MTGQNIRAVTALVVFRHTCSCVHPIRCLKWRSWWSDAQRLSDYHLLLGLWRCCSVPSSAGLRELSAAVPLSRGFTFPGPTLSSTVLLVGLSEWGFWRAEPCLSTAPARPRTEEHGSRLTHLAGTAHHVPPAQTKAALYWRLLRIIPSASLSAFIKKRKMKMKERERASHTYTLLKIKVP